MGEKPSFLFWGSLQCFVLHSLSGPHAAVLRPLCMEVIEHELVYKHTGPSVRVSYPPSSVCLASLPPALCLPIRQPVKDTKFVSGADSFLWTEA